MKQHLNSLAALAIVAAACGGGTGSSTTTTAGTTTTGAGSTTVATATTVATTTTIADSTTTEPGGGEALTMNPDGSYTIDWEALGGGVFFAPPVGGSSDPFFHVHTDPATHGFFFSVEAYTTGYGSAWTGELGDFEIGCAPTGSGICVHFDPDGPGAIADLGADFMATGDVTIVQADADGFVAIFSNVEFSDGTTIPGPFTVTG